MCIRDSRENNGNGPFRFPGFESGAVYNEKEIIEFMRSRAFGIDKIENPRVNIPLAPKLLEIKDNYSICLLYTSDAADERSSVDLGGRRIIKKKKKKKKM